MSFQSAPRLLDRLTAAGGRPSGFDYLRLILSTAVVLSHTVNVCYGTPGIAALWSGPARGPLALILPMFFALSGFLVAGSLERSRTIVSFAGLRIARIVPALFLETVLSAMVLGPLFTDLPLYDYFAGREFRTYFWNIVGHVHYTLPGVFTGNPRAAIVNTQLWTLPFELYSYAALAALAVFGWTRRPRLFLAATAAFNLLLVWRGYSTGTGASHYLVGGWGLVLAFLYGVCASLLRTRITWSGRTALACLAVSLVLLAARNRTLDGLALLPAAYLTVYLGLLQPVRWRPLFGGDYSYGIFLYGFPVQQAAVAVLGPHPWYVNFAVAMPVIVGLAVMSWHVAERPALSLRPWIFSAETALVRWTQAARNRKKRQTAG